MNILQNKLEITDSRSESSRPAQAENIVTTESIHDVVLKIETSGTELRNHECVKIETHNIIVPNSSLLGARIDPLQLARIAIETDADISTKNLPALANELSGKIAVFSMEKSHAKLRAYIASRLPQSA
ncbi:MAG: hypothetical protein ABJP66_05350 [Hyphomicrobiales bacterium]